MVKVAIVYIVVEWDAKNERFNANEKSVVCVYVYIYIYINMPSKFIQNFSIPNKIRS
jgi:hypothetical protein